MRERSYTNAAAKEGGDRQEMETGERNNESQVAIKSKN